jgi:hypothetical protein
VESGQHKPEDDHFFPYDLMRKGIAGQEINNILNVHFLNKDENGRKGKQPPSQSMNNIQRADVTLLHVLWMTKLQFATHRRISLSKYFLKSLGVAPVCLIRSSSVKALLILAKHSRQLRQLEMDASRQQLAEISVK